MMYMILKAIFRLIFWRSALNPAALRAADGGGADG